MARIEIMKDAQEIVLMVDQAMAASLSGRAQMDARTRALIDAVRTFCPDDDARKCLVPMFPGNRDEEMETFFVVEHVGMQDAARLVQKVRKLRGIKAAFTKPHASVA